MIRAVYPPLAYSPEQVYKMQDMYREAIDTLLEALEFSPENPELLTTLGLLYLRSGDSFRAVDFLGNSLTQDPRNTKTILGFGSVVQDRNDHRVCADAFLWRFFYLLLRCRLHW